MSRVPPEIFELPIAERIELAQELWESVLDHPEALPLTEAQKAELERRWQALEAAPDAGQWGEARKRRRVNEWSVKSSSARKKRTSLAVPTRGASRFQQRLP